MRRYTVDDNFEVPETSGWEKEERNVVPDNYVSLARHFATDFCVFCCWWWWWFSRCPADYDVCCFCSAMITFWTLLSLNIWCRLSRLHCAQYVVFSVLGGKFRNVFTFDHPH